MAEPSYLMRSFLKYNVIFQEGSRGDAAYLLKEGLVEVSKDIGGKKKVLAILKPISLFGEMAIILEDQKRTATAVALEDVKVVEIKKDDFEEFVRMSPQIMQSVLNILVHRLKAATVKSMRVPSVFHGSALALDLFARHGVTSVDHLAFKKFLSQAFIVPPEQTEPFIETLAGLDLVEMQKQSDGARHIVIKEPKNFAAKAVKRLKAQREEED